MEADDLRALISKTANLMESYQRQCGEMEQRQHAMIQTMQGLTQQLPSVVKQSTDSMLSTLPGQMTSKVREGLEQTINDYQQRLRSSVGEAGNSTQALTQRVVQLEGLLRHLMWKITGTVVIALILLLGGGAWLSMHYIQVIRDNQLNAELLKAYNGADVSLCGQGQLCANVDTQGFRAGERKQYLLVRPR